MATEEQINQKQILDFLKQRDFHAWRNFNGAIITGGRARKSNPAKNSPDIMGWLPCGKALQIEVKGTEKSIRSPGQIEWIERAIEDNVFAIFAWSLDQVVEMVSKCGHGCRYMPRNDCPWQR